MRKFLFLLTAIAVASCIGKYGKGGDNAAQFVREKCPDLCSDAKSVEVVSAGDCYLIDAYVEESKFADLERKEFEGEVGYNDIVKYADGVREKLGVSLSSLSPGYAGGGDGMEKRKIFFVEVTKKSSQKIESAVIMEADGTTPAMLADEYYEGLRTLRGNLLKYSIEEVLP